ncbi:MAG TPA: hypothetical protein VEO74_01840 [Thermoanaerobaculia bacterium]|nr:hypothetical protein [Thermoanaerobaculia bacterium]
MTLVKVLLNGLPPDEAAAFRDQLVEMLSDTDTEQQPAPDRRPPGADRRVAQDRLPRGVASFNERFPNASRVGVQSVLGVAPRR